MQIEENKWTDNDNNIPKKMDFSFFCFIFNKQVYYKHGIAPIGKQKNKFRKWKQCFIAINFINQNIK